MMLLEETPGCMCTEERPCDNREKAAIGKSRREALKKIPQALALHLGLPISRTVRK